MTKHETITGIYRIIKTIEVNHRDLALRAEELSDLMERADNANEWGDYNQMSGEYNGIMQALKALDSVYRATKEFYRKATGEREDTEE